MHIAEFHFDVMLIVFLHFSLFFMKQNILNRNIFSIFLIPSKRWLTPTIFFLLMFRYSLSNTLHPQPSHIRNISLRRLRIQFFPDNNDIWFMLLHPFYDLSIAYHAFTNDKPAEKVVPLVAGELL